MAKMKMLVRPAKPKKRHGSRKNGSAGLIASAQKLGAMNYKEPGDSIGVRYKSPLEAAGLVKTGLPFGVIGRLHRTSGLTLDRIKQVASISEGSFFRRKKSGRFSSEESERLLRLSRIFEHAASLYDGDQDGARQWLETPIPALGNQRPLDVAGTEPGAREVEDLIGRIEHGIVS